MQVRYHRPRWTAEEIADLDAAEQRQRGAAGASALGGVNKDGVNTDGVSKDAATQRRTGYPQVGDVKTKWEDILLWAVLANEPEIVQAVWAKTSEPLRFAIWAAHLAELMSKKQV